jgi:hypothetical protein
VRQLRGQTRAPPARVRRARRWRPTPPWRSPGARAASTRAAGGRGAPLHKSVGQRLPQVIHGTGAVEVVDAVEDLLAPPVVSPEHLAATAERSSSYVFHDPAPPLQGHRGDRVPHRGPTLPAWPQVVVGPLPPGPAFLVPRHHPAHADEVIGHAQRRGRPAEQHQRWRIPGRLVDLPNRLRGGRSVRGARGGYRDLAPGLDVVLLDAAKGELGPFSRRHSPTPPFRSTGRIVAGA